MHSQLAKFHPTDMPVCGDSRHRQIDGEHGSRWTALFTFWLPYLKKKKKKSPRTRKHFLRVLNANASSAWGALFPPCILKGLRPLAAWDDLLCNPHPPYAFKWLRSVSYALRRGLFLPPCIGSVDDDGGFRCLSFACFAAFFRSFTASAV